MTCGKSSAVINHSPPTPTSQFGQKQYKSAVPPFAGEFFWQSHQALQRLAAAPSLMQTGKLSEGTLHSSSMLRIPFDVGRLRWGALPSAPGTLELEFVCANQRSAPPVASLCSQLESCGGWSKGVGVCCVQSGTGEHVSSVWEYHVCVSWFPVCDLQ